MINTISDVGELLSQEINSNIDSKLDLLKQSIIKEIKRDVLGCFYLTRQELKDYLKFKSITSVDNLVRAGLPKYKVGSKTLFKRLQVDEFIQKLN